MSDETGYDLNLVFFYFAAEVQRSIRLACLEQCFLKKNIGGSKTIFLAKWTYKNKMLNGERDLISKT